MAFTESVVHASYASDAAGGVTSNRRPAPGSVRRHLEVDLELGDRLVLPGASFHETQFRLAWVPRNEGQPPGAGRADRLGSAFVLVRGDGQHRSVALRRPPVAGRRVLGEDDRDLLAPPHSTGPAGVVLRQ